MAKQKIKTPVGELRWVFITGDGKDQSEARDGSKMQKMASIVFKKDDPKCKELQAKINEVWEEWKAEKRLPAAKKPKSLGYKELEDKETGEPTGEIMFTFKTNSFYPDGKPNIVTTYNAKGQKVELPEDIRIGNGSIGIIFGTAAGYEYAKQYGISLYLTAIQIAKLVEVQPDIETEDLSEVGDFESVGDSVPSIENEGDIPV